MICDGSFPLVSFNGQLLTSYDNGVNRMIRHYYKGSDYLQDNIQISGSGGIPWAKFFKNNELYFFSGAGPYDLISYQANNNSSFIITSNSSWDSKNIIKTPEGDYIYLERQSSMDEILRLSPTNGLSQISSLNGSIGSIYNISIGPKGFYLFTSMGVYRHSFENQEVVQLSTNTIDQFAFKEMPR